MCVYASYVLLHKAGIGDLEDDLLILIINPFPLSSPLVSWLKCMKKSFGHFFPASSSVCVRKPVQEVTLLVELLFKHCVCAWSSTTCSMQPLLFGTGISSCRSAKGVAFSDSFVM